MYTFPFCERSCRTFGLDWASSKYGSSCFVLGMHRRNTSIWKFSTIIFLKRMLVISFRSGIVTFFTTRPTWYNSSSSSSASGTRDWSQYARQTNCFVQGTGRCFFPLVPFALWPNSSLAIMKLRSCPSQSIPSWLKCPFKTIWMKYYFCKLRTKCWGRGRRCIQLYTQNGSLASSCSYTPFFHSAPCPVLDERKPLGPGTGLSLPRGRFPQEHWSRYWTFSATGQIPPRTFWNIWTVSFSFTMSLGLSVTASNSGLLLPLPSESMSIARGREDAVRMR